MNKYVSSNDNRPQPPPRGLSIASMVLGLVGLVAWFFPLVGFPVTIVGLILGIVAMNQGARGMATVGVVLSGITLFLTLVNSILGAVIGALRAIL